ncbi:glutamine synthetase family protein [Photobacterium sp. MCCC 1A19761]|uniref:glutamine synthetase family protein n=1 Tax=Photobacterium sp. MCCC 1A19761 TaxID=3115000 RepID=UPI00307E9A10
MEDSIQDVQNFIQTWPDVRYIDLLFYDLNASPRGKRIPIEAAKKLARGIYLPVSNNSLSVTGSVVESAGLGEALGEPDHLCHLIPGSLRPGLNPEVGQAQLQMMAQDDATPCPYEARNVLLNIVSRLHARQQFPVVALELEFYLIDKKRDPNGQIQPPINPATEQREANCDVYNVDNLDDYDAFLTDVNEAAKQQNLNTDGALAESAPGQFELNFFHQQDVVAACDQLLSAKRIIRQAAQKHGFDVTFMAKPFADQAGSGQHIHLSVLDEHGRNRFSSPAGEPSAFFYQTIAAMLNMMPETIALLCPNVNSYRRFAKGMFTPTLVNWGHNHRGVALRVPKSDANNRRLEHRIAGADVNPYILAAVVLSGVLHAEHLTPEACPAPASPDAQELPTRMSDALDRMAHSEVLTSYFGKEFLDLYLACKQSELVEFEQFITPLEVEWMLHSA